jgi:surface protein
MNSMFQQAASFNADLSQWDTSKVTRMDSMFNAATSFNADLSQWDTSQVTRMDSMFYQAANFNANLSQWDTSKVTSMSSWVTGATCYESSDGVGCPKANACNRNMTTCVICTTIGGTTCRTCRPRHARTDDGQCQACAVDHCVDCPTDKDTCAACKAGYNVVDNVCQAVCFADFGSKVGDPR